MPTLTGLRSRKPISALTVGTAFIAVTCVALLGKLPDVNADARGTTVVAASILDHGSLTLAGDAAGFFRTSRGVYTKQVSATRHGVEYAFPLGPVFIAMPVVLVAKLAGISALRHDALLQTFLVGVSILLTLTLTYLVARRSFNTLTSATASILIFFGTLIGPTISGAFWSLDCEIVLIGAVVLTLEDETRRRPIPGGIALGVLLFLGFLCRPTFAAVIVCAFAYLAVLDRRKLVWAAMVAALLLVGFIGVSESHFGTYLPPYYLASRLSPINSWSAALGLLASPSRSIVIFSPVLAYLPFAMYYGLRSRCRIFVAMLAMMMFADFLANVMFWKWWAGFSYGPRISADLTYTGCLLILIVIGTLSGPKRKRAIRVATALLVLGLPIGFAGIFCRETRLWNSYPSVDDHPQVVWDWRYPQFLSLTAARVREKCVSETRDLSIGVNQTCPP